MPSSCSEILLQKFSERQSDKWKVDLLGFREKCPFYRVLAMECELSFASLGLIHMLMSGRIIPAVGEPTIPPSVDSALELFCHLWVCLLVYRLGLYSNLTCRLGPIDFNRFRLCPCAMSFFQRLCSAPLSLLFPAPFLSPIWAHNVASTIY